MAITAAVAVSVGSTAYSIDQQRSAKKDQEKAARLEQQRRQNENIRNRRKEVAQSRSLFEEINAQGTGGGLTGSSQQIAQANSLSSQLGEGVGHNLDTERFQNERFALLENARRHNEKASMAQSIGGLVQQGLGAANGFSGLKSQQTALDSSRSKFASLQNR